MHSNLLRPEVILLIKKQTAEQKGVHYFVFIIRGHTKASQID